MTPPTELLHEILRDACRAPSGDNTQPWRFKVSGDTIRVINAAEKDTSLFNWRQRTNHVALGACIENMKISAEGRGYRVDITCFPDPSDEYIVAEISFTPDPTAGNNLASYINKRASNRKKYWPKKIEKEKLNALANLSGVDGRISFIVSEVDIQNLASIVSAGEKLALENKDIHDFLFSHVTWNKNEDARRHGFLIDTFEFALPQRAAFKLFSRWSILKLFLPFGIANAIAKDMERVHATAAAFGAIIAPGDSPEDFLRAGMLLQRLWLTATSLDLSLQGVTAVGFLGPCVLADEASGLDLKHQQLLRVRYGELSKIFALDGNESFGFVFRLGYADPPSAITTRFEPVVEWA